MKINGGYELKGLDGEALRSPILGDKPMTLGKTIAVILVSPKQQGRSSKFDAVKAYILSQKFYESNEVELDDADFEKVKEEVMESQVFTPLVTGQIISVLNKKEGE